MEVTIGEIIKNIRLENINVEAIVYYGDNEISQISFYGIGNALGYSENALDLGFDVTKKVKNVFCGVLYWTCYRDFEKRNYDLSKRRKRKCFKKKN